MRLPTTSFLASILAPKNLQLYWKSGSKQHEQAVSELVQAMNNKAKTKLLFECVKSRATLVLQEMLEQDKDAAKWRDVRGDTALHVASWCGVEEAAILLCSAGANIRQKSMSK